MTKGRQKERACNSNLTIAYIGEADPQRRSNRCDYKETAPAVCAATSSMLCCSSTSMRGLIRPGHLLQPYTSHMPSILIEKLV